ncbi:unnamed protein product [Dicrocoelium dendriticum]|nr:unnamed protein product [Dicrocoelium dendriticum]
MKASPLASGYDFTRGDYVACGARSAVDKINPLSLPLYAMTRNRLTANTTHVSNNDKRKKQVVIMPNKLEINDAIAHVRRRLKRLPIQMDERALLQKLFKNLLLHDVGLDEMISAPPSANFQVAALERVETMIKSLELANTWNLAENRTPLGKRSVEHTHSAKVREHSDSPFRGTAKPQIQSMQSELETMEVGHLRHYDSRNDDGYVCYFCHHGFTTVVDLHAHFLTQEHICLEVPIRKTHAEESKDVHPQPLTSQANNNNVVERETCVPAFMKIVQPTNRQGNTAVAKPPSVCRRTMLPHLRCMYCGASLRYNRRSEHSCFEEMSQSLTTELQHMDVYGSPFVCLLCHGRVFDTPSRLQLHLVACHGAGRDFSHCALCEMDLECSHIQSHQAPIALATAYDRHLNECHLPDLLLAEKLLFMCPTAVSETAARTAPTDDVRRRGYRCVFLQDLPAGSGPPFPFPHWVSREIGGPWKTRATSPQPLKSNRTVQPYWSSGTYASALMRPSKTKGYRSCLVSPTVISELTAEHYSHIRSGKSGSSYQPCCGVPSNGLFGTAQLIAHVLCNHAGNPYTVPGFRELVLAKHVVTQFDSKKCPLDKMSRTVDNWMAIVRKQEEVQMAQSAEEIEQFGTKQRLTKLGSLEGGSTHLNAEPKVRLLSLS